MLPEKGQIADMVKYSKITCIVYNTFYSITFHKQTKLIELGIGAITVIYVRLKWVLVRWPSAIVSYFKKIKLLNVPFLLFKKNKIPYNMCMALNCQL